MTHVKFEFNNTPGTNNQKIIRPAGAFKKDWLANKNLPPADGARADTVTPRPRQL